MVVRNNWEYSPPIRGKNMPTWRWALRKSKMTSLCNGLNPWNKYSMVSMEQSVIGLSQMDLKYRHGGCSHKPWHWWPEGSFKHFKRKKSCTTKRIIETQKNRSKCWDVDHLSTGDSDFDPPSTAVIHCPLWRIAAGAATTWELLGSICISGDDGVAGTSGSSLARFVERRLLEDLPPGSLRYRKWAIYSWFNY